MTQSDLADVPAGPVEDWSEIEALLQAPTSVTARPALTWRASRLTIPLAALVAIGGVAAWGVASTAGCRGDACRPSTGVAALTTHADDGAVMPQTRLAEADPQSSPDVGARIGEGRSAAEVPTQRRAARPIARTTNRPGKRIPLPPPRVVRAFASRVRPLPAQSVVAAAAAPRTLATPMPTKPRLARAIASVRPPLGGRALARVPIGPPRYRQVWISPTHWILVERD